MSMGRSNTLFVSRSTQNTMHFIPLSPVFNAEGLITMTHFTFCFRYVALKNTSRFKKKKSCKNKRMPEIYLHITSQKHLDSSYRTEQLRSKIVQLTVRHGLTPQGNVMALEKVRKTLIRDSLIQF
jgi:hypothetical protein